MAMLCDGPFFRDTEGTRTPAAERQKNAAHGASRGFRCWKSASPGGAKEYHFGPGTNIHEQDVTLVTA
jgi:hypothetical protein